MKLTDKYSPMQVHRPIWSLYNECAVILGHILDDKFEMPHVSVYEHTRHTFSEMFHHARTGLEPPHAKEGDGPEALAEEEQEVLDVLIMDEEHRRLTVVGDVGVGKTTFLRHLVDVHFNTAQFPKTRSIYLDWKAFTAPLKDPLPAIYERFVNDVYAGLEQQFDRVYLHELDDLIYRNATMFARSRSVSGRFTPKAQATRMAKAIEAALQSSPVDFTCEKINAVCKDDRNALVLVIDNIDQLHPAVLDQLFQFLIEIQTRTVPLVIVAMRDHTFERGFSAYRREGTTPSWTMRLKAPNVRKMLERRIDHFLPGVDGGHSTNVVIGSMKVTLDIRDICRALLEAPLLVPKTYEFLVTWANFNIRELFKILQVILGNYGFTHYDKQFLLSRKAALKIGVDECLIGMALGNYLLFYSTKSIVFNPYSTGTDAHPCDRLVAIRMLQFLRQRDGPVMFADLRRRFKEWGYSHAAIDAQVFAMANKDVIWTDAGPPADIDETTRLRISYRGSVYASQLIRRAIFGYMMSFDVHAPSESHAVARHDKHGFRLELEALATFDELVDSDLVAQRVLGLAELMFESELRELQELRGRQELLNFKSEVAPTNICVEMVSGLSTLLTKMLEAGRADEFRFKAPSNPTLQQIAESKEKYQGALAHTW